MTGSIQKKKGRANYYAVLNAYDASGKRRQQWIDTGIPIKGSNKRRADTKLNELLVKFGEAEVDLTQDMRFTDFMQQWLETRKLSLSPSTYDAYRMTADVHLMPYFKPMNLRVRSITPAIIQKYSNDKLKKLSPNTVRKHLANISKCLDSAMKQGIIAFNPVKRIELPRKVRFTRAKHYNERQIEQLLEHSKSDPLALVIQLTLFYGLRRSEILGLMWDAVDFETRTIAIKHTVVKVGNVTHRIDRTKNDSSYAAFPMPKLVVDELRRWKARQDEQKSLQPNDYVASNYICTREDGQPLSTDYISRRFAHLLRKSGMPHIRFHDLRHSSANYLKHLGFDLKDIQTWLRHKDIQTTMNIYVALDMDAKEGIADKLNARFRSFSG